MKHLVWTVSATLLVAATATAQAGPSAPSGAAGSSPYHAVSDIDGPYYSEAPPVPIPAPAPRYGYGPDPDDGYRTAPAYVPERAYRPEPYRPDGYRPDYSYAPAFLPVHAVYAIVRDNGFSPLGEPRQRGITYVIAVLDRDGEDGRLVIDARSGRILRFVPAFQWGEQYERMRYQPGHDRPIPIDPRAGPDSLPPPTVIKADPHVQAMRAPLGSQMASRAVPAPRVAAPGTRPAAPAPQTAMVQPKPETRPVTNPAEAKPVGAQQASASASASQPQATSASPPPAAVQKATPQILPTETMPPAQGLE